MLWILASPVLLPTSTGSVAVSKFHLLLSIVALVLVAGRGKSGRTARSESVQCVEIAACGYPSITPNEGDL